MAVGANMRPSPPEGYLEPRCHHNIKKTGAKHWSEHTLVGIANSGSNTNTCDGVGAECLHQCVYIYTHKKYMSIYTHIYILYMCIYFHIYKYICVEACVTPVQDVYFGSWCSQQEPHMLCQGYVEHVPLCCTLCSRFDDVAH